LPAGSFVLFARRVVAYLIDMVLLFAVLAPLGWLVQTGIGWVPERREIWLVLLVNFSLPSWTYFTILEARPAGATIAKALAGVRVRRAGALDPAWQALLLRTAVKLLPWELVHLSAFALAPAPGEGGVLSWTDIALANAAILVYLGWAFVTGGRRSLHDLAAGTWIERSRA
jgi:uncharacterized RDD family membrane protein YckC